MPKPSRSRSPKPRSRWRQWGSRTARLRPIQQPASTSSGRQYAPLDAFRLLRVARHFFPGGDFEAKKIDGFTADLVKRYPGISRGKFNFYMRSTIDVVRQYKTWFLASVRGEKFNAFTEMRHALYAANPDSFAGMLTNVAPATFDGWRAENAE